MSPTLRYMGMIDREKGINLGLLDNRTLALLLARAPRSVANPKLCCRAA